jgi:hypothetical protein
VLLQAQHIRFRSVPVFFNEERCLNADSVRERCYQLSCSNKYFVQVFSSYLSLLSTTFEPVLLRGALPGTAERASLMFALVVELEVLLPILTSRRANPRAYEANDAVWGGKGSVLMRVTLH